MQVKTFIISVSSNQNSENELNLFLRSNKIFNLEKDFVANGINSYWAVWVQYDNFGEKSANNSTKRIKSKIDYKEKLDPAIFEIFAKLREIRKKIAIENGVAVYIVFTNEELENIALLDKISVENMLTIKGVGQKRIEKYGKKLVELYNDYLK